MLKRGFTPNGKELWNWRKIGASTARRSARAARSRSSTRRGSRRWSGSSARAGRRSGTGPALNAKNNDIAIEEMEIASKGWRCRPSANCRCPRPIDARRLRRVARCQSAADRASAHRRRRLRRHRRARTRADAGQHRAATGSSSRPSAIACRTAYLAYAWPASSQTAAGRAGSCASPIRRRRPARGSGSGSPGRDPFVVRSDEPGRWGNAIELEAVWGRDRVTHLVARTPDEREQTLDLDAAPDRRPAGRARVPHQSSGRRRQPAARRSRPRPSSACSRTIWTSPHASLDAHNRRAKLAGRRRRIVGAFDRAFHRTPRRRSRMGRSRARARRRRVDRRGAGSDGGQIAASRGVGVRRLQRRSDSRRAGRNHHQLPAPARDRVAILDVPPVDRRRGAGGAPRAAATRASAALYHPWIVVDDPLRIERVVRHVPPSGHVAGMYRARRPPARRPQAAGERSCSRAPSTCVESIDDQAHGELNDADVNAIRPMPGRGILVLGVRTLDPDVRWRYVNVRRLFAADRRGARRTDAVG